MTVNIQLKEQNVRKMTRKEYYDTRRWLRIMAKVVNKNLDNWQIEMAVFLEKIAIEGQARAIISNRKLGVNFRCMR